MEDRNMFNLGNTLADDNLVSQLATVRNWHLQCCQMLMIMIKIDINHL